MRERAAEDVEQAATGTDVRRAPLVPGRRAVDPGGVLITYALVVALVSVPLLGGRLGRLADLRFRHGWLVVAALALQILIIEVVPGGDGVLHRVVHLGTYAMLFVWAGLNLQQVPFLWLMAAGGLSNAIAIAANDGVMPAAPAALAAAGIEPTPGEFINSTAVDGARLQWLGDVFAVPASWPVSGVFSAGDVLLIAGVMACLHATCRSRLSARLAPA